MFTAALLALHAHGWLHVDHFDEISGQNDSACVACQIGQNDGPLAGAKSTVATVIPVDRFYSGAPVASPVLTERGLFSIRAPPQSSIFIS